MKFRKLFIKISVFILIVLIVGQFAFRWFYSSEPTRPFVYPTKGDIRDVITAKGTVGYRHQVSLRAGVAGRLERMPLQEGATVRNDQLLFRIVDPQANTDQLSRATTQERHALHIAHLQRDVSDLRKLVAAGATARQELEARQAEL